MTENRCFVCNDKGDWENVDEFRLKKVGMCICRKCGFITYPDVLDNMNKLKQFYRDDYRGKKAPTSNNLKTGLRKINYHAAFLKELLSGWKDQEIVVGEVGSAIGMFLDWVRKNCPKADVNGTELTTDYRHVAWNLYGIHLKEELDLNKKYDLIASYKVAEHMIDFDKELQKYKRILKPDGYLYISVPTWFNCLCNFGVGGFDIEYYYHKNHINVWTVEAFKHVLAREGFKIVKENYTYYDETFLCVLGEEKFDKPNQYDFVKESLQKVLKAHKLYSEMKHDEAIKEWPNFPQAWLSLYESTRAQLHKKSYDVIKKDFLKKMIEACPNRTEALLLSANVAARYDDFESAIKLYNQANEWKPNSDDALNGLAMSLISLANMVENPEEKNKILSESNNVLKFMKDACWDQRDSAINWLLHNYSQMPMPT